jgi:hypothetical protein
LNPIIGCNYYPWRQSQQSAPGIARRQSGLSVNCSANKLLLTFFRKVVSSPLTKFRMNTPLNQEKDGTAEVIIGSALERFEGDADEEIKLELVNKEINSSRLFDIWLIGKG